MTQKAMQTCPDNESDSENKEDVVQVMKVTQKIKKTLSR